MKKELLGRRSLNDSKLSARCLSPRYLQPRCISPRCFSPRCLSPGQCGSRCISPRTKANGYSYKHLREKNFGKDTTFDNYKGSSRLYSSPLRTVKAKILSAYDKIKSDRSIKNTMLPGFIRINNSEFIKYQSSLSALKMRTADTTVNDSNLIKSRKQSPLIGKTSKNNTTEIMNLLFDTTKPNDQLLLSIGRIELSRTDLICLKSGKILPDNIVDACLKCVKKKNTILLKKGKIKESIYCLSTKFCKYLFQSQGPLPNRLKKNLLGYNYLLFPINIGYWTILIVSTKGKYAKYYDPVGIEKNDNTICTQLFALLKREIKLHENKDIETTRWQRLEYERINEYEAYDHINSSVYIVRQAFKVAICKDIQVRPEILPEHRNKLLYLLFKYGTKIAY